MAEFDIIIYGATGFTGRLVAEYMHATYPDRPWAMAGRSATKLAAVRDEMGLPADTPLIEADASDPASLDAMVARARVIITTVGPYLLHGEPLVAACAKSGTDYVDLSGEPPFMWNMIEKYNDTAKESGARIVHSCGFDSIPFDMGVYFLQQEAQKRFGAPIKDVKGRVRGMKGTFSGGTAASGKETMKLAMSDPETMKRLVSSFALTPGFEGPKQPYGNKPYEDSEFGMWVAPFVMASINTKNVHRSNMLMGHPYGTDFTYEEMIFTGKGEKGEAIANGIAKSNPMGDDDIKPGEGPSKEERDNGSYDLMFTGTSASGERLTVGVKGDRDPGYGSTSKMLTEAAICLIEEAADAPGGVLTAAPVFGAAIIDRLTANAGLTFEVES
ncbi:saccharopine dehydrogenase NADP-binding domain-containing protein [Sulfitobacter sp. S223]|uniref:saccharopine dehydrogenase family protein n=1 Tax=Sulfitobacter sp. S223 TaxID=2867023 RepID=UPI0021A889DC|nr:saccharopine dehydrogenase NADP-binding domain-containing protein [Sulfitobacter sp. S223]UWR26499.1 saccharopine dehydrogenase NADP-binding domain-containing protein [Sulfitobacter sp. S223]